MTARALILLLTTPLMLGASTDLPPAETSTAYEAAGGRVATLEGLREIAKAAHDADYDMSKAARVEGLTLARDVSTITLDGYVFLREPVVGLLSNAVFFGEGRIAIDPPIEMERDQVERFLGTRTVDEAFETASISFDDPQTQAKLEALEYSEAMADEAREKHDRAKELTKDVARRRTQPESSAEESRRQFRVFNTALALYDRILDSSGSQDLRVTMTVKKPDEAQGGRVRLSQLAFSYDSDAFEETTLTAGFDHGRRIQWSRVTSFSESDEYRGRFKFAATSPILERKKTESVTVSSNELVLDIDPKRRHDTEFRIRTRLRIDDADLPLLRFYVTPLLAAKRASIDGKQVELFQPEIPLSNGLHAPVITLMPRERPTEGQELEVTLELEGSMLTKLWGTTFVVRAEDTWYPRPLDAGGSPRFDTTIRVPRGFVASSNGAEEKCRDEHELSGSECFRFVTRHGLDLPFFNVSSGFLIERGEAVDGTPIAVYLDKETRFDKFEVSDAWEAGKGYWTTEINLVKTGPALVNKARAALAIFEEWFGEFPYGRLALTPHPKGHGRGGASMLLLAQSAFMTATDLGNTWRPWGTDAFVSHEIAHQWWGNVVGIRGDRDQWFSEGFADYASVLYLEYLDSVKGTTWMEGELKSWYEVHTKDDAYINSIVPLCLGNRIVSAENRDGYDHGFLRQQFMYNKGGFVMHMLRTYARYKMGDKEKGDALFKTAVKAFIEEHHLEHPSNLDMMKSFGLSYGESMQWFFDQWVFGRDIPKIQVSHELGKARGKGRVLRLRVVQRGKTFKFPLPVFLHFGRGNNSQTSHFYQLVTTQDETFELPLPRQPDSISFNDDYGVLAVIDEVPWSEPAAGQ